MFQSSSQRCRVVQQDVSPFFLIFNFFLGCPMCRVTSHLEHFWICDLPLWQGIEMCVYHVCALKFAEDSQTIFFMIPGVIATHPWTQHPLKNHLLRRPRLNENRILESLRTTLCDDFPLQAPLYFSVHSLARQQLPISVLSTQHILDCRLQRNDRNEDGLDWQFQSPQSPQYMQSLDKLLGLILERLRTPHDQSCGSPCWLSPT